MTSDNKMKLLDAYRMAAEGGHKEIADALASVIIGEMSGIGRGATDISPFSVRTPGTERALDTTWGDHRVMCETGGTE
jgi:hypothetical protein